MKTRLRDNLRAARLWLLLAVPQISVGHDLGELRDRPWSAWNFTPDVLIGAVLTAMLYVAGMRRWRDREAAPERWRHGCFFAGLAAMFFALQSPIDPIAEHLFFVHQIQHLLLGTVAPMFIMLSAPQALLVAGMPVSLRQAILRPIMTNAVIRAVFGFFARPVVATGLFAGVLCFWQIPRYHDLALLNEGIHYLMHVTMLFTGLVFFWRVLDPRPAPLGASYGVRLAMLWVSVVATMLLGVFIALKSPVLYPAYELLGRLWGIPALSDERYGGLTIWIPGGMMCIVALIGVIRLWGAQEAKMDLPERARPGEMPRRPTSELRARQTESSMASRNRRLALRLAAISVSVVGGVILVATLYRLWG